MVYVLLMLACSGQSSVSSFSDTGEVRSDHEEEASEITARSLRCRLMEIFVEQEWEGGSESHTTIYSWEGNTQSFDGGSYTYNDFGYVTESYFIQQDWEQIYSYEYECDMWCRLFLERVDSGSDGMMTTTSTEYTWEGNTQREGTRRYVVYNDYGAVVEMYEEGLGYVTQVFYEYECSDWCRLLRTTSERTVEGQKDTTIIQYEWNGNLQSFDGGYYEYNEYGYMKEVFIESETTISLSRYQWDCD